MNVHAPLLTDSLGQIARDAFAGLLDQNGDCNLAERLQALRDCTAEPLEPLLKLASCLELGDAEILAASVALEIECDPHFARSMALAQEPVGQARPLAGMLARITENLGGDIIGLTTGRAVQSGLLTLGDEAVPLSEKSLYLKPYMAMACCGKPVNTPDFSPVEPDIITLTPAQKNELVAMATAVIGNQERGMIIRSTMRTEGLTAAAMISAHLGKALALTVRSEIIAHTAWFEALGMMPVFECRIGVGETWQLPDLHDYEGPWIVLAAIDGTIEAPGRVSEYRLDIPDRDDREALWISHGLDKDSARLAAQNLRQGAGRIDQLGRQLQAGKNDDADDWQRLKRIVRAKSHDTGISAHHVRAHEIPADSLVLTDDLRDGLGRLVDRVRQRDGLADRLGPAIQARYRPGVTALLCGESGTGKTMAAHWLADRIGLPLYRVDMATLTSKWIGETEKNLSKLLSTAENSDLILFFDEADSLFGARTDVSDSHDRYANAQTNFLLQRIEDFDGIAILSTNSRDRFDSAFVRRLDAILEFPLPDASARRELWIQHIGNCHDIAEKDLDRLAIEVDISGGHIRNIVLSAAVTANGADRAICIGDIAAAVESEFGKLGKASPAIVT